MLFTFLLKIPIKSRKRQIKMNLPLEIITRKRYNVQCYVGSKCLPDKSFGKETGISSREQEEGSGKVDMIDLHTHILPGIDDGSRSMEASVTMAEMALDSGTTMLVATPHANQMGRFENFFTKELFRRFRGLKEELEEEEIPLKLYLGMEIFASEDMGEKIRRKQLIGLNGSRYYLVEFGFHEEPERIERYLDILDKAGAVPLIAHPERYDCVKDDTDIVAQWKNRGALIQLNQGSLLGHFGTTAAQAGKELLERSLVTCVASDAHGTRGRTPGLEEAQHLLRAFLGDETTKELLEDHPRRILANQTIPGWGRNVPGM
jgi:protein-tyrosine phosphatase